MRQSRGADRRGRWLRETQATILFQLWLLGVVSVFAVEQVYSADMEQAVWTC